MSIDDITTEELISVMEGLLKNVSSDEIGNYLAAYPPIASSGIDAAHLKWVIDQDRDGFVTEMMIRLRLMAAQSPQEVRRGILTAWGLA